MNTYTYIYIFIHPEVPKSTYKPGASTDFRLPSPLFKTHEKKRLGRWVVLLQVAMRPHANVDGIGHHLHPGHVVPPKNWPLKVSKPAF